MVEIVLFLDLHQPRRARKSFTRGKLVAERMEGLYFDDELNREILIRTAKKCYAPALKVLIENAREGGFKCALGASGIFLEQCERWDPDLLRLIQELLDTGACEMVAGTYYRSLASQISGNELREQIELHRKLIRELFRVEPSAVANTDFIYDNRIAKIFEGMGFKVALTEFPEAVMGWHSPCYLYKAEGAELALLMRNSRLSDDIGFRFTDRSWPEWPLTPEKYAGWLSLMEGDLVFLALDMATFGEHHPAGSGILDFLRHLPGEAAKHPGLEFATPTAAAGHFKAAGTADIRETISWADAEKDLSCWLANAMQQYSFQTLLFLEPLARLAGPKFMRVWRLFSMSDHYLYMSTKGGESGAFHGYLSSFSSPVEAFMAITNAMTDFKYKLYDALGERAVLYKMIRGELPSAHAFRFFSGFAAPLGLAARNLTELKDALETLGEDSLKFHLARGDLSRWVREVLGADSLSVELDRLRALAQTKDVRADAIRAVDRAIADAEGRMGRLGADTTPSHRGPTAGGLPSGVR